MSTKITLVGLGLVGSSIGLALKQTQGSFLVTGHDKDSVAARRAQKNGCVDRTDWNLINACDEADLVVLSTPLPEIKATLAAIAQDLKQGCVVTDTASLKVPVCQWARESLPQTVHFVGGHPILGRTGPEPLEPAAGLLADAVYCLTPGTDTSPEAIRRASDLAEAVGASPYFLDPAEHDGLIAAAEQLPLLLAVALQAVAGQSSSKRELIQLSGVDFVRATQLLTGDAESLTSLCTGNTANILHWLDAILPELSRIRELVADEDTEGLQEYFKLVVATHDHWTRKDLENREVDYKEYGAKRSMEQMWLGDLLKPRKPKGE